ncbi:hypothetical protein A3C17_04265 [Candidatus Uhrbacteria bacterium RIFCSPHIGHO2_02_FULL_53_13]|uniref:RNA polymerase sigma factor n=2 Tax=Candidatus Uhriibacteriota TaxID=1752732 RepID=A0A1F7TWJ3_9BACT|nr:MAG: hypothetical protein A3C17_04265 [Candidatus Uhrbacteria bacterium RIFCSPHIGHO2_02_FULL_53_13]OGL89631.1 MAG: hypothetical protein A3I45_04750 [Candidatus Uhrbacteria bacterium RIFCSPLOWO2_02_FULL_53_10]
MHRLREQFLLHRIRTRHDTHAFAEIYDAYADRITRFVRIKVGSMEDAQEIQSDVFERAWKSLCEQRVRHLSAYLYTVARRAVADHYRMLSREVQTADLADAAQVPDDSTMESIVMRSDLQVVEIALDHLYEDYRELIVMRFMDGLSIAEIAEALQKTPNNVRVTLHRAVGSLKRVIDEHDFT